MSCILNASLWRKERGQVVPATREQLSKWSPGSKDGPSSNCGERSNIATQTKGGEVSARRRMLHFFAVRPTRAVIRGGGGSTFLGGKRGAYPFTTRRVGKWTMPVLKKELPRWEVNCGGGKVASDIYRIMGCHPQSA